MGHNLGMSDAQSAQNSVSVEKACVAIDFMVILDCAAAGDRQQNGCE